MERQRRSSLSGRLSKLLIALTVCLASCTPIQGYPGLERPAAEIARVDLDRDDYTFSVAAVDGIEFTREGAVTLLPGEHQIAVSFERDADCNDDAPTIRPCLDLVDYGTCHGSFAVEAGERYSASIETPLISSTWYVLEIKEFGLFGRTRARIPCTSGMWRPAVEW